ncbi:MAG: recombination regulator RecX [Gammaproteobacteria bacterium]|nr:recombination regulator RecX [Gammaproteobacteria bacterium]MCW8987676.1 recombination regulator RecX [Gammaproteobacteria bacterium]MCW9030775.1 recombination regulator RecX [Gammaproteobacteria bacterium]
MAKKPRSIREAAMDYLSRREHATHELFQKLLAKGYESDDVSAALERLADQDLLSDSRFTEAFINQRINRGSGPLKIRAELRQKGISDAMIGAFLNERDVIWQEAALAVRAKKYGSKEPSDLKERARQTRFLQSRGFSSEQTRYAMREDNDEL